MPKQLAEHCHVSDRGCRAPIGCDKTRATCYRCGNPACTNCSKRVRVWVTDWGWSRRRVCNGCVADERPAQISGRQQVPVSVLEYDEGGHTLWVHGPDGATVLRIKLLGGKYRTQTGCVNICAHADIVVPEGDVEVCMPDRSGA